MVLGQYKESLKYFKKYITRLQTLGQLAPVLCTGLDMCTGRMDIKKKQNIILMNVKESTKNPLKWADVLCHCVPYYDLAGVYAFMGEKEKAYRKFKKMGLKPCFPIMVD